MGLFDWLRRIFGGREADAAPSLALPTPEAAPEPIPAPPPEPENQWRILSRGDELAVVDPDGTRRAVAFSQLTGIVIETSDSGAAGLDFWWLFYGPDEDVTFTVPLGATGEQAMTDRIMALPGFREESYLAAIRSNDIETYVIWQRPLD